MRVSWFETPPLRTFFLFGPMLGVRADEGTLPAGRRTMASSEELLDSPSLLLDAIAPAIYKGMRHAAEGTRRAAEGTKKAAEGTREAAKGTARRGRNPTRCAHAWGFRGVEGG